MTRSVAIIILSSLLFSHNEKSENHIFPKTSHAFSHALILQLPSYTQTDTLTPGAKEIYRMAQDDIYKNMNLAENVVFVNGQLVVIEEEEKLPFYKKILEKLRFFKKKKK